MSETNALDCKSPLRKLVAFFQKSRNAWKEKHHVAKAECKKLSNQVRAVEKSRQRWRERAEAQEQRADALERELKALKSCLA